METCLYFLEMKRPGGRSTPDHILETARALFFERGFAVGVDEIVKVSAIAKMSLYRYFPSKTDLVKASIESSHGEIMAVFDRKPGSVSRETVVHTVLTLCRIFSDPDSKGGLVSQAVIEFRPALDAAHKFADEKKIQLIGALEKLCTDAGIMGAKDAASQLLMLVEGHFALCGILGPTTANRLVQKSALLLAEG